MTTPAIRARAWYGSPARLAGMVLAGCLLSAAIAVVTPLALALESWRQNRSFGQLNLFLALMVAAGLLWPTTIRPKWAGIGVGLATSSSAATGEAGLVPIHRWWQLRDGAAGRLRIGIAALVVIGLLSWGIHPGTYRVDDWTTAGVFSRLVSGVPTIWCLLVVLPAHWWRPARITASRPLKKAR